MGCDFSVKPTEPIIQSGGTESTRVENEVGCVRFQSKMEIASGTIMTVSEAGCQDEYVRKVAHAEILTALGGCVDKAISINRAKPYGQARV